MLLRRLLVVLVCFQCSFLFAQKNISGKVVDEVTKEPLAFCSIIFNNNPKTGATSDIDGKFEYHCDYDILFIKCSFIGYEAQNIPVNSQTEFVIKLKPNTFQLDEIVLSAAENPANRIIKKVIANKNRNNPEKISSFTYECYNKTVYDFLANNADKTDSLKIKKVMKGSHLLLMESVTRRKFLLPDSSEEVIIGTKVSGFKNPKFASLATDLQPFSFYGDNIKFININYLNPIADGSLSKYQFYLKDEYYRGKDTIFIISYRPKKGKNFEGLTGVLHINSNKYAIQNVTATPFEKGKIDLKIQQQYQQIGGEVWFPEQLNYVLTIKEYPDKKIGMFVNGKSYINNVKLNGLLKKRGFAVEKVRIDENANQKDSLFWSNYRIEPINPVEKKTYVFLDSIGNKYKLDKLMTITEKLMRYKFPLGVVDLDLTKIMSFNEYEGARLGCGFFSNENLSKKLTLGAFAGYGFRDKQWKYGGSVAYEFSKKHEFSVELQHQNNLQETGFTGVKSSLANEFNFRNYIGFQMDKIIKTSFALKFRAFKYSNWMVKFQNTKVNPTYLYQFDFDNKAFTDYYNSEIILGVRWAPNEKIISLFDTRTVMESEKPVFNLYFSKGLKGIVNSNWDYNKIEATADQSFYTKNLGKTAYHLEIGYVDKPLPYGLLFTGSGGFDSKNYILTSNFFQTMKPYEFLSDQYVNLFLSHNFAALLFKTKIFQPDISLHHNMGIGSLQNPEKQQLMTFKTNNNLFVESGIQFDNVLKMNYLNIGYLGLGFGAYYRYGAYNFENKSDNFAFKISFTFSIK